MVAMIPCKGSRRKQNMFKQVSTLGTYDTGSRARKSDPYVAMLR